MTDPTERHDRDEARSSEEERIRSLLEGAGRRPEVPAEDLAAIRAAFRTEWAEHVRYRAPRRSRSRTTRSLAGPRPALPLLALAATVLAALGLGWWLWRTAPTAGPEAVARIEVLQGAVTARDAGDGSGETDGSPLELAVDREIPAGAELVTGTAAAVPGRVALRLAGGPSLRFDTGSRVHLVSGSEIELERGAVYVDTRSGDTGHTETGDGSDRPRALRVRTPLGVVRDIGTRFEVRLLETDGGEVAGALRLRVREGRADLSWDATSDSAGAGEELTLHADGSLDRDRIDVHGPAWDWILRIAPPFEIEGRTLGELLVWVARETGWEVRYGDPALAEEAGTIVLHGSLGESTPDQAPGVVLPGAGLTARLEEGSLVIER